LEKQCKGNKIIAKSITKSKKMWNIKIFRPQFHCDGIASTNIQYGSTMPVCTHVNLSMSPFWIYGHRIL